MIFIDRGEEGGWQDVFFFFAGGGFLSEGGLLQEGGFGRIGGVLVGGGFCHVPGQTDTISESSYGNMLAHKKNSTQSSIKS